MPKTLIVVPCFNEADRFDVRAFAAFVEAQRDADLLFVDDGSKDSTLNVLASLCARLPQRLYCLPLTRNQGKAEAVRLGFRWAFERPYAFIGYFDADLATPLQEILLMGELFANPSVQVVLGSRVALLGKSIERKRSRHYLGRVFATAASAVLQLNVYDTQCGAKMFRNTEYLRAVFNEPFSFGWIFDVEILARFLLLERYKGGPSVRSAVVEHALHSWRDIDGSKLKPRDAAVAATDLARLWRLLNGPGAAERAPRI